MENRVITKMKDEGSLARTRLEPTPREDLRVPNCKTLRKSIRAEIYKRIIKLEEQD